MDEKFYETIFKYQKILHTKFKIGRLTQEQLSHYYHLLHLWSINNRNEGGPYAALHTSKENSSLCSWEENRRKVINSSIKRISKSLN